MLIGAITLKHTSPIVFMNCKVFQSADKISLVCGQSADDRPIKSSSAEFKMAYFSLEVDRTVVR